MLYVMSILILLCPLRHAAWAGNQVWSGTGPRAKSVEAIVRDPLNPSRLWAATFGAGVYRTVDGGATWTGFRNGLVNSFVRSLAANPAHPDSLYCGTNDGVFLSTDGGVNWAWMLPTSVSVRSLAIPHRLLSFSGGHQLDVALLHTLLHDFSNS